MLDSDLAQNIWDRKYGGDFKDTIRCMIREVVGEDDDMENMFLEGRALPGGRILYYFACLSQDVIKNLTPNNCFVIPIKEDSISGIMEFNKEMALTFKAGGGVGTDISCLRPRGSTVNNAAETSTGAVSFLPVFDKTTETIGQKKRRGAFLAGLSVYHPDIIEFIQAKKDGNMSSMNISVKVDSNFMESENVSLWYPHPTSQTDDPKIVEDIADCYSFPDEELFYIQRTGEYRQKQIYKTLPRKKIWDEIIDCAWKTGDPGLLFWDKSMRENKIPLHCTNPCGELPLPAYGACALGSLNMPKANWVEDTKRLVKFLDSLISYCVKNNLYPLKEQKVAAKTWRPLGIGVTGIADWMILNGWRYGEEKSLQAFEEKMREKSETEKEASAGRNAQLSTIAPTGSISMLLDCSSGIEPNFSFSYEKKVGDKYLEVNSRLEDAPKEILITAHNVSVEDRVRVQAIAQKYIDGSISSTINLRNKASREEVAHAYRLAWSEGLKGVTVFRDGCKEGGLRLKKKPMLEGKTVKVPVGNQNWYVTVNENEDVPWEIFINAGKSGSDVKAWTEGMGRVMSLFLQSGGAVTDLIKAISDIKGSQTIFKDGWSVQSGPDGISKALSFILEEKLTSECPACGEMSFIFSEGCGFCSKCYYEKC